MSQSFVYPVKLRKQCLIGMIRGLEIGSFNKFPVAPTAVIRTGGKMLNSCEKKLAYILVNMTAKKAVKKYRRRILVGFLFFVLIGSSLFWLVWDHQILGNGEFVKALKISPAMQIGVTVVVLSLATLIWRLTLLRDK